MPPSQAVLVAAACGRLSSSEGSSFGRLRTLQSSQDRPTAMVSRSLSCRSWHRPSNVPSSSPEITPSCDCCAGTRADAGPPRRGVSEGPTVKKKREHDLPPSRGLTEERSRGLLSRHIPTEPEDLARRRALFQTNDSLFRDEEIIESIIELDYRAYRRNEPAIRSL